MKKINILFLFVSLFSLGQTKVGAVAEYDKAKLVLMHEPSYELFYGVIHPNAALFDTYFDAEMAAKEHRAFQKLLQKNKAEVITVKEALLKNIYDEKRNLVNIDALNELRQFARTCIHIDTISKTILGNKAYNEQLLYLDKVYRKMNPNDLIKTILLQPKIKLKKTATNTFITADYQVNPVMNLYFLRDQLITTKKGVILTSLNSPQRAIESKIIRFCLKKIGIKPLIDFSEKKYSKEFIEGGDFLTFGNTALIGQGMRTNSNAIKLLLENDYLGTKYVAVVKDQYFYQPQMHLDTYFNIIDKDLVAISDNRYHAKTGDKQALKVDLYQKVRGTYKIVENNISFKSYLQDYLKVNTIVMSNKDQENYGLNFLCIAPRKIIAVEGQSADYIEKMKHNNVEVQWVDFTNLKQGWGAAHCTTQVIAR